MGRSVAEAAARLLQRVREQRPLVHHITNVVAANDVANATLAVGALPVMAHAREEVEEVVAAARALSLNLGTLTPDRVEAMLAAGNCANRHRIPVVLDPVGVGATRLRAEAAARLVRELHVTVVKGNLAEMAHLAGVDAELAGVESVGAECPPEQVALGVARRYRTVAAVTGSRDWVGDGRRLVVVDNGHPMLKRITGAGCMATAVVACFLAVSDQPLVATACALAYFGHAAELAAQRATGPGSFRWALLDCLADLEPDQLRRGVRAREVEAAELPGGVPWS